MNTFWTFHRSKLVRQLLLVVVVAAVAVAGCSKEVQYALHFGGEDIPKERIPLWPQPPEKPRYRFFGELTGVDNFEMVGEPAQDKAERVFMFLVGLDPLARIRQSDKGDLNRPQTGMVDEQGRIYVTDVSRQMVMVFDQKNGKLHVWTKARDMIPFASPVGIAQGAQGEILVADSQLKVVVRLNREGAPLGEIGRDILNRPTGLARDDKRGVIYVADTGDHNIKVFDDQGTYLRVIGKRGEEDGYFNGPTHITFAHDKLYVADTLNARVQVFNPEGNWQLSFGRRGIFMGEMVRPKGVTVDKDGNIYVVESFHDHLLVFNQKGEFLLPIGGTGKEIGEFYLPSGLWTDHQDRIYVADMFNGRIMIFNYLGDRS